MTTIHQIPNAVIYVCMGLIVFLMVFLILRFVLQMIFLKECPNCGRTVSLIRNKECKNCGYVFLKERYLKLSFVIFLLITAVIGMCYLNVKTFKQQTASYIANNPRIAAQIALKKAQEAESAASTESTASTENVGSTENAESTEN